MLLRSGRDGLVGVGVQVGAVSLEEVRDSVEQPRSEDEPVVGRCPGGSPAALKDGG